MATSSQLRNEALLLLEEAQKIRAREVQSALEAFFLTMQDLEISPMELQSFLASRGVKLNKVVIAPVAEDLVVYCEPATGAVWSGKGAPPDWIIEAEAEGIDRRRFLVNPPEEEAPEPGLGGADLPAQEKLPTEQPSVEQRQPLEP